MILVEKVLGNIGEPDWDALSRRARLELLVLEQWDAPKSRLRKTTEGGLDLAISLPRGEQLHDGDVLHFDEDANRMVVARVALKDVLVIELQGIGHLAPTEILRIGFELGHGLGNQHWPAVIKGTTVYVPLSVDQKVMASVMRTHAFAHVTTRFAPGEEIAAKLDAREARILFAGADATPHHHHPVTSPRHVHGHGHGDHSADHTHDHDHDR
jgi:urease accessory protein